MKKLIVYFSIFIFSMVMFVGCSTNNKNSMEGIYLRSTDGTSIIIDENYCPIIMSNKTNDENIFEDFKNGDKIQITYDSIAETYPAKTQIYSCELIKNGSIYDIPKDTLTRLQEMGFKFEIFDSKI